GDRAFAATSLASELISPVSIRDAKSAARITENFGKFTLSSSLTRSLTDAALSVGKGGVSVITRAIQKHAGRAGSAFSRVSGNLASRNEAGRRLARDILENPLSSARKHETPRFGEVIDVETPDGRGLRFSADGKFIGLLEPKRK
ncbi:MAG: hypothetical protein AAF772_11490, partial [Acidobacteriota bacterium]